MNNVERTHLKLISESEEVLDQLFKQADIFGNLSMADQQKLLETLKKTVNTLDRLISIIKNRN